MGLINKKAARLFLLDEARAERKARLNGVSLDTYRWLEEELIKRMRWLVSVHPHGGPKTIKPPKTQENK